MDVNLKHELFVCACEDVDHQMIIGMFDDEPELYVSIHLVRAGFFRRLWTGIKYILGKKSKYGDFDEILLEKKDIDRLRQILDREIKPKAE